MATYYNLDSQWRDRNIYPNPCDYHLTVSQVDGWRSGAREVKAIPRNPSQRPLDFMNSVDADVRLPYPRIELYANSFVTVDSASGTGAWTVTTLPDPNVILADGDAIMTSATTWTGVTKNTLYYIDDLSGDATTGYTFTLHLSYSPLTAAVQIPPVTYLGLSVAHIPAASIASTMATLAAAQQLIGFPLIFLDVHSELYNDLRSIQTINSVLADARFVLEYDKTVSDVYGRVVWIKYRSSGEQVMRFKRNDPMVIRFFSRDGSILPFFNEPDLDVSTDPYKQSIVTLTTMPYLRDADYSNHTLEPIS